MYTDAVRVRMKPVMIAEIRQVSPDIPVAEVIRAAISEYVEKRKPKQRKRLRK